MNERIEKLAELAGFGLRRDGEIYTSRLEHLPITEDLAKFAELIVKECARIAFDESAHAGRMNKPGNCLFGNNIGRRIEKHFGVEE